MYSFPVHIVHYPSSISPTSQIAFELVHVLTLKKKNLSHAPPVISLVQVPFPFYNSLLNPLQPFSTWQGKWFVKGTSLVLTLAA